MTDGKTWGDTVLGWFVVRDAAATGSEAAAGAAAEPIPEGSVAAGPAIAAVAPVGELPAVFHPP